MRTFVLVGLLGLATPAAAPPETCTVAGEILFNSGGDIHVDLVTRASFNRGQIKPDYLQILTIGEKESSRGRVSFEFKDVPVGTYVLRSFQDENGNGVLDTHFLGAPREPWGMYRPARPVMRAPRFDEVAFELKRPLAGAQVVLEK